MTFLSRLFKRGSLRAPAALQQQSGSSRPSSSSSDDENPPERMTGMLSAPADLAFTAPRRLGTSERTASTRRAGGEMRRSQTYTAGSTSFPSDPSTTHASTRPSVSSCDGSIDDKLRATYGRLRQTHLGRLAVILEGVDRRNKQPVIIKAYAKAGMSASMYEQLEREQSILRTAADCPGVVRLLDLLDDSSNTYMVLENVPGYTLIELMAQSGGRIEEARCVQDVVAPLLRTLTALHALGIVHRDIKPEHIMCSFGGVKLVDFAHAAQQRHQCLNHRVGQLEYMAPEVLAKPTAADIFHQVLHHGMSEGDLPQYDEKADAWSLGCVVYEALTGQQPFMAESAAELAALHNSLLSSVGPDGTPLLLQHPCISEPARNFLFVVLQADPQVRPSALHLLQHPWVMQHTGGPGAQANWLMPPSLHGSVHSRRGSGTGGSLRQTPTDAAFSSSNAPPTSGLAQQQPQQQQQQHPYHEPPHRAATSMSALPDAPFTSASGASTHSSLSADVLAVAATVATRAAHGPGAPLAGCCASGSGAAAELGRAVAGAGAAAGAGGSGTTCLVHITAAPPLLAQHGGSVRAPAAMSVA